jgi:hypothetical protein
MNMNALLKEIVTEYRMNYNRVGMEAMGNNEVLSNHMEAYILTALVDKLSYTSLGEESLNRYFFMGLEELLSDALNVKRIMYYSYLVELEPGASIEVELAYIKGANYNYGDYSSDMCLGYDIANIESEGMYFEESTIQIINNTDRSIESEDIQLIENDGNYEGELDLSTGYYRIYMKP